MKILVVSDSHGDCNNFRRLLMSQPKAEVVLFLGDGAGDFDSLRLEFPEKMFIGVKGNCDWCSSLPIFEERTIAGKKIFMTHGHAYGVKFDLTKLFYEGKSRNADIVLFGHTHIPLTCYEEGMHIMNPGSLHGYNRSFGVIDIQNGDVLLNTATLS